MKGLLEEILDIPNRAEDCYQKNQGANLPLKVPYIGMGSSYFAALTLFYCGKDIYPQLASEYYYYLSKDTQPLGVLISQSGESSETLWNLERFENIVAVTNNPESSLARSDKLQKIFQLHAGEEKFSSTKTHINTLVVLYLGLAIDPHQGIEILKQNFSKLQNQSAEQAKEIFNYTSARHIKGLYVIGSGPNLGVAHEGALVMSETTKFSWAGMSVAEYDHGPKETADETVILILNSNGKDKKRIEAIKETLKKKSTALVIELTEEDLSEQLSPLTQVSRLYFIMNYLADHMGLEDTFDIGGKVTTVPDSIK